jgi:ribonuclease T2
MNRSGSVARFVYVLFLIAAALLGASQRQRSNRASQGQPGVFDYYLLTLSWSPEFCYSHAEKPECQSGHHGFVVHGLWPQYVNGYPENCSSAPGLENSAEMTDLMPDSGLVVHEWSTHGTCSGLDAENYFQLVRRAFASVKVPDSFRAPGHSLSLPPQEVKSEFLKANPGLSGEDLTVSCGHNYLTAVSICLSKDLRPVACQNLRDCRANVIRVSPIR